MYNSNSVISNINNKKLNVNNNKNIFNFKNIHNYNTQSNDKNSLI